MQLREQMFLLACCVTMIGNATQQSGKVEETPKYQTAYACEGKQLTIECDPGDLINLIRANYGRFSITICNDHGNVEWSVNCMFPKSLTVLNSRCAHKQSCSVLATTSMFGDPCPGTHKYLEAHYQCISAAQTSTTTNRPSPPWLLPNGNSVPGVAVPPPLQPPALAPSTPPLLANGSAAGQTPSRLPLPGGLWSSLPSSPGPPTQHTTLPGGRLKGVNATTALKNANRHDGLPPPPPLQHHHTHHHGTAATATGAEASLAATHTPAKVGGGNATNATPPNTRILTGVGGAGSDDGTLLTAKTSSQSRGQSQQQQPHQHQTHHGQSTTAVLPTGGAPASTLPTAPVAADESGGVNVSSSSGASPATRTINNVNNLNAALAGEGLGGDDTNMFCGPTNARNLFWNMTRVGDVNVQPCPGGATGIAKWRCVLMKRITDASLEDELADALPPPPASTPTQHGDNCGSANNTCEPPTILANRVNQRLRHFQPTWHPLTPDLTQCRSLWLNNLEVRVNQPDSSLISIANDLSEVTSSKTLYGGDMLVTTKIIQTMSEKMFHDKETFPDQRQREAIILELLHGVVKTGSNLLDESQLSSWLDLNQEDQMRVATSLLTGLEYNAFLLADTIIRERNVVQKVKNILLSVRVLETKNIQSNEVFPDAEQWQISDDRIELPRAALIENSEGGLVRIVFAAFDRLESILKPSYDHFDMKSARSYVRNTAILANDSDASAGGGGVGAQQRIRILNSKVISASLGKGRHIQLSQPIKLVLRHLKTENVTNPTCVFWNYIDHAWSANGCNLESSNRSHSVCMCNHLTNFAILMDVLDEHNHSLFTMFDGNMRALIYISIAICLVFIVIALLTLKIFNGVFIKSARTSIYRSIYVCLLFIEILFLFGIEQTETSIFCGFTTVFLHCSILSAIAWFCFEAFQSYSTLTTDDMLLEVDQTSKVNCYYLLSYGLAFTVVAISLAINPSTYTQNDFCVLMEANALFYASFVTPIMIFLVGALGYTFLAWLILCRKSRMTLKNKEHTRLANVRFDIRCSFIFLLLLCSVWVCAYYYLRRAKLDDELAIVYGYLFVGCNTAMGLYIFVFHCIQNEKIRREYRKYVRQNSWLPKCLRCSKTSISSGIVGGSSGGGGGVAGGCASSTSGAGGAQSLKKTKLPLGDAHETDETGGIISAAEDAIMASSDCELNEAQGRRAGPAGGGGSLKGGGIMPGSLVLQHGKANSIIDSMQGHVVLERAAAALVPGASGTLRSQGGSAGASGGVHTPSAGHTSPTSSVGSTHLIFGHGHKLQQQQQHPTLAGSGAGGVQEAFYHHPDHNSWSKTGGAPKGASGAAAPLSGAPQQAHEFFYWTQKHSQQGKKGKRGGGSMASAGSPSGSLHARSTAASQQILFYPSYKKTTLKNQPPVQPQPQAQYHHHQQYPQYAEALEPSAYYQQQQQSRRHPHHHAHLQQQQSLPQAQTQQLSSDDEHMESAAHAHLLHLSRRAAGGGGPHLPPLALHPHYAPPDFGMAPGGRLGVSAQRYYGNKPHSNCDLSQDYDATGRGDAYYNQGALGGGGGADGPVYEEIMSNRSSGVLHYDMEDDEDNVAAAMRYERGLRGGGGGGPHRSRRQRAHHATAHAVDDNDDDEDDESACDAEEDDDDEDDDDDEAAAAGAAGLTYGDSGVLALPLNSDERMRRLMAMQDEDFQRRFQRQQRKNGEAVFGSGGGGAVGAARSYKKASPGSRVAVNELFNHGPPLPPANQHPMQKRQQHQQLSPQGLGAPSHPLQQQPVGRNISAMLDENNTVRCYLEPLSK